MSTVVAVGLLREPDSRRALLAAATPGTVELFEHGPGGRGAHVASWPRVGMHVEADAGWLRFCLVDGSTVELDAGDPLNGPFVREVATLAAV